MKMILRENNVLERKVVGGGKWGVGSRKSEVGSRKWGVGRQQRFKVFSEMAYLHRWPPAVT
jgi:hypothetical protein